MVGNNGLKLLECKYFHVGHQQKRLQILTVALKKLSLRDSIVFIMKSFIEFINTDYLNPSVGSQSISIKRTFSSK